MTIPNHYDTLGVRPNASIDEIELAYKGRRTQYHPDRYSASDAATLQWATEQMQQVNAAYSTLSDGNKRQQYDAELNAPTQKRRAQPVAKTSHPPLSFPEYLNSCGVKKITSDRIFFHPNIPAKKLAGATSGYATGIEPQNILILIDDTVFGSGKDGVVVTSDRLIFKQKFDSAISFRLADIRQISCDDNDITINDRKIGSLALAENLSTGYVFHVISSFLTALALIHAQATQAFELPMDIDLEAMERVLMKYTKPIALKHGADLSQFGGRYPSYHVGKQIPEMLERMVRFTLCIPEGDQILSIIDLWNGQGEAVAFTNRGIYSRCRASNTITAYDWSSLRERRVTGEFELSVFVGVVFDDGCRLICERKNAVLRSFCKQLIADLINLLSNRPSTEEDSEAENESNEGDELDPEWLQQRLGVVFDEARQEFGEMYHEMENAFGGRAEYIGQLAMEFFQEVDQAIQAEHYDLEKFWTLRNVQLLSRHIDEVMRGSVSPDPEMYRLADDDIELVHILKTMLQTVHEQIEASNSKPKSASEYFSRHR